MNMVQVKRKYASEKMRRASSTTCQGSMKTIYQIIKSSAWYLLASEWDFLEVMNTFTLKSRMSIESLKDLFGYVGIQSYEDKTMSSLPTIPMFVVHHLTNTFQFTMSMVIVFCLFLIVAYIYSLIFLLIYSFFR